MADETIIFAEGVDSAHEDTQPSPQERKDAGRWLKRIKEQREFDAAARKGYALDRRYARGDAGQFEVDVPIAQSYIDVLRSFLYARDPDVDVRPAVATEPPPHQVVIAQARKTVAAQARQQQQAEAQQTGQVQEIPPQELTAAVKAEARRMLEPFQQRRDDAKQLAATLEIVVSELWKQAQLKKQALPQVNSALTVGAGWIKAVWLERSERDPVIEQKMTDVQDRMRQIAQNAKELDEGEAADAEAAQGELSQQLEGLQADVEQVVQRGFAVDFVAAEDVTVGPCRDLSDYTNAPWISHRTYMAMEDAKSAYPELDDRLKQATEYHADKPRDPTERRDTGLMADVDASEADAYQAGKTGTQTEGGRGYVCVEEVWNRDANTIITLIHGMQGYAKPPHAPDVSTSRFYPFFLYEIGRVDGDRHPKSLVARSHRLFDEYNRTRSNFAEHRRRTLPKQAFDATNYSADEISKLEAGGTTEMVPLKPVRPGSNIRESVTNLQYPGIDPALYDTAPIRADLELIWGIQEALSSSIHTAKTATEAEIQQQGTESRTGYMREGLDDMLGELAHYTAEIALQRMDREDVTDMAGPWAFWPEGMESNDMRALVQVDIRAGSSGKPDTTAEQKSWAQMLPILQEAIQQVSQLRNASPDDIADSIEELVQETLSRSGERMEAERFLPQAPEGGQPPDAKDKAPISQSSLQGQQVTALIQVVTDIRAQALSDESAKAIIMASFPDIPDQLVGEMIAGAGAMPINDPQGVIPNAA